MVVLELDNITEALPDEQTSLALATPTKAQCDKVDFMSLGIPLSNYVMTASTFSQIAFADVNLVTTKLSTGSTRSLPWSCIK